MFNNVGLKYCRLFNYSKSEHTFNITQFIQTVQCHTLVFLKLAENMTSHLLTSGMRNCLLYNFLLFSCALCPFI